MATKRKKLNDHWQEIAAGPFLLQIVAQGDLIRLHIGSDVPNNATSDYHTELTSVTYAGSEKAFARAQDTTEVYVVVTEIK